MEESSSPLPSQQEGMVLVASCFRGCFFHSKEHSAFLHPDQSTEISSRKILSSVLGIIGSASNMTTILSKQSRQLRSLGTKCLSGPTRALTWTFLERSDKRYPWQSPFNLTELEKICKDKCQKILQSRCGNLVASNPKRLKGVIEVHFFHCIFKGYWVDRSIQIKRV